MSEAFHQTERFRINCLDEILKKPQIALEEEIPWSTKTVSDGLVVKFNDKQFSCMGLDGDNFFQLKYSEENFL